MAAVYRDSKYFKVGESYRNPLTKRLVKVGGRTFNKLYVEFGDDALYKHENEPQERIVEAIRSKPPRRVRLPRVARSTHQLSTSSTEPEAQFELLARAFKFSDKSYEAKFELITFEQFRTRCMNPIRATLVEELREMRGLKYFVSIKVQFSKIAMRQNEEATTITTPFIRTKTIQVINEDEIIMDDIFTKLTENIAAYQREGSGWKFDGVSACQINISKYAPLRGSSYINLPKEIKLKHCCINVKNKDNECFKWAVLSALHPVDHTSHPDRVSKYQEHCDKYDWTGIKYPTELNNIQLFERLNNISINVFGYDKANQTHPLYITKYRYERSIDLLLISNGTNSHYCWIKNFNRLLSKQYNNHNETKYFCKKCLHGFTTEELLKKHGSDCVDNVRIELPTEENKWLEFKNIDKQLKVPFIIYADFEAITEPIDSVNRSPDKSYTESYQKHEPCGYAYKVVCIDSRYTKPTKLYRGENCIEEFMNALQEEEEYIGEIIQQNKSNKIKTNEDVENFNKAKVCHICNQSFNKRVDHSHFRIKKIVCSTCKNKIGKDNHVFKHHKKDDKKCIMCNYDKRLYEVTQKTCGICKQEYANDKVWDHCHITGKYRGAAHNGCNLKYKIPEFIPVVFHNLRGYDSHFLVKVLGKFTDKVRVIPNNMEKYMSISVGRFRFIDSFQFMSASLEALAKNLKKFPNLESEIKENVDLLKQKGVYPYDYMDSWEKFEKTKLPPISGFYSRLSDSHISNSDYKRAKLVWSAFKIRNMGEYHDLYLKTDVLLLADVFENFRDICLEYYKLDPAHYFTSPGLAWDAMLKLTKVKLERLTDPDMYLMIEKGIRGGISVNSGKYSAANNKYMKSYDETKPSKHITYLDANNLYGWAMCQLLPTSDFKWIEPDEFDRSLGSSQDSDTGYILEVDLEYPAELHDLHNDYPLAPESLNITDDMLSEHSKKLKKKLNIGNSNVPKLTPNLNNKTKYVAHYRNLKFYLEKGLKLTKIHRVLQFKESAWLKPYIDFNTEKRKKAKSDFEKDFFKLMNNAVFGKTMENIRKRVNVEVVNDKKRRDKLVSKPTYDDMKIIDENLVVIKNKRTKLRLDKPIYCGFAILDLSKLLMYDFHYNTIKSKYGSKAKLLYTDTDSLIYEIETEDVYQDMFDDKQVYDFSDYPEDSKFYDVTNKKVVGKFKDETAGVPITEFVGLRSKMYSMKLADDKEKKTAKGIKKSVVKNTITHNDYKKIVLNGDKMFSTMNTIRSSRHQIYSYTINKVGLCAFDDKRYVLDNGYDTLAHGHYLYNGEKN
jgi:hypothetical protein